MQLKRLKGSKLGRTAVAIEWEDAWSENVRYFTLTSIALEGPLIMHTVGILIRDDEDGMAVANNCDTQRKVKDYRDVHFIPRAMIRSVKILK